MSSADPASASSGSSASSRVAEAAACPPEVLALIERFAEHRAEYTAGRYKEDRLRTDFLDPLFAALGWDVENRAGYAESYRDVVREDRLIDGRSPGGRIKAPDYSFRVGGARKFFVEAKKPSVDIKNDPLPAFQLRRYAWSAKLPLSILTDFEEIAVYDCRAKPSKTDKPSKHRVEYFRFEELPDYWAYLDGTFSQNAILKGAFDKYAAGTRKKRGTAEVDDAFLEEIEGWREALAKDFAKRNPGLSVRGLNRAVQQTIDRIVFLRIAEDRGLEPYKTLHKLASGGDVYAALARAFRRADDRYNSGLFHFKKEAGRPGDPDDWTLDLTVGDPVLKTLLAGLYYPDSPYEFAVLPADILGQVYERFLGKVVRLTPAGRAKVEEKPEVRKAGGVYYTPTYIVDYIVEKTVGELLTEAKILQPNRKTRRLDRSLRVLDPACGSGSFLLGAYQYLLDWHLKWYVAHGPDKLAATSDPPIRRLASPRPSAPAEWALTTGEKKRILLAHLHGVDIDAQAVEVTKLSLLLKVLEGETDETLEIQRSLFLKHERPLPDLSRNIQCGNSLIGPDFYDNFTQGDLFDAEARLRVNAFDWQDEFPEAMADGGFDAVIGNPPYIRIQTMTEWAPEEVAHIKLRYKSAAKGNFDVYVTFIEKGLDLLNGGGLVGLILPHKFMNSNYGEPVRTLLAEGSHVRQIVHFGDKQVFSGATVYVCLLFLSNDCDRQFQFASVQRLPLEDDEGLIRDLVPASDLLIGEWNIAVGPTAPLYRRLRDTCVPLEQLVDIFVGLQTSADAIYHLELVRRVENQVVVRSKAESEEFVLEAAFLQPLVSGRHVDRYKSPKSDALILFPYKVDAEKASLLSFEKIEELAPLTAGYLYRHKRALENRERGKFKGEGWHRFGRSQNLGIQSRAKLCVPRLLEKLYSGFDLSGRYTLDNVDVGGVSIKEDVSTFDLWFLLATLNSRLARWYFSLVAGTFRGGYLSANRQFLGQLPIPPGCIEGEEAGAHVIALSESAKENFQLHEFHQAATGHEKTALKRQIAAADKRIDQLVYELYGLSEDEIALVEVATG